MKSPEPTLKEQAEEVLRNGPVSMLAVSHPLKGNTTTGKYHPCLQWPGPAFSTNNLFTSHQAQPDENHIVPVSTSFLRVCLPDTFAFTKLFFMETTELVQARSKTPVTEAEFDASFKPKGAIAFFILLIILGAIIWFGIYFLMLQRA